MSDERKRKFAELDALAEEARRVAREDAALPLWHLAEQPSKPFFWQDRRTGEIIPPRTWRHHVWDMLKDAWAFCFGRKP